MKKRICDICDKNVASNNFKVKQEKCFGDYDMGFVFPRYEWVEIDICDECFEKMKTIKDYKNQYERICDEAVARSGQIYGDDKLGLTNYLMGVEAAMKAIDPKIQFDPKRVFDRSK